MNTETIIACDPGASGGFVTTQHGVGLVAFPMPGDRAGIIDLIQSIMRKAVEPTLYIEMITGYAPTKAQRAGEEPQYDPATRVFKQGRNYECIQTAFLCSGMDEAHIIEVSPMTWQKPLKQQRFADKAERKRNWKALAQRIFPQIKVTLKTADALLIYRYASNLAYNAPEPSASRVERSEVRTPIVEAPAKESGLFIAWLHGILTVLRNLPGGGVQVVRPATAHDLKIYGDGEL